MRAEVGNLGRLTGAASGAREGWVGREARGPRRFWTSWSSRGSWCLNTCFMRPDDYDRIDGLPDWAKQTLLLHASDSGPCVYDRDASERAATPDPLLNAQFRESCFATGGCTTRCACYGGEDPRVVGDAAGDDPDPDCPDESLSDRRQESQIPTLATCGRLAVTIARGPSARSPGRPVDGLGQHRAQSFGCAGTRRHLTWTLRR